MQPPRLKLSGILALAIALVLCSSLAFGATITGTVKGPDGAPYRAAFIEARDWKTRITTIVLSDSNGHYRVENLVPGEYRVYARSTGYRSDPHTGVLLLTDTQTVNLDWTMNKRMVSWSEIPNYTFFQALPPGRDKRDAPLLRSTCGFSCHGGFQLMADFTRDEAYWHTSIKDMKDRIESPGLIDLKQTDADELAVYINQIFGSGPGSLPKDPSELPGFKDPMQQFSDEALKIVYVMYDLPESGAPWSAKPDKIGNVWLPLRYVDNTLGQLNPKTGEVKQIFLPDQERNTSLHSVDAAPDGTVWVSEEYKRGIVKYDPKTGKFKGYYTQPMHRDVQAYAVDTVRVDGKGIVWLSGTPLGLRFDPKTEKFTELTEMGPSYGVEIDKGGNAWFNTRAGEIVRVDLKTEKLTKWKTPPTKEIGGLRRMQIDNDGIVWVGLSNGTAFAGGVLRLDPETGEFKTFPFPGAEPTPYGLGFDTDHHIWYASQTMDTMGRLDPATGKVTEYPPPYFGWGAREILNDPQGRMWTASAGNNAAGYFYLAK